MNRSVILSVAASLVGLVFRLVDAQVIPPNLRVGFHYQLRFVTSGSDTSTSSAISDYNAFVSAQAALDSSLPAATWYAVASTSNNPANTNAPWVSGVPVYNTHGDLVATAAAGIYTGSLTSAVGYDQFGAALSSIVWTGSSGTGTALNPLGSASVGFGSSTAKNLDWIHDAATTTATQVPLYALSTVITAVPEPSTLTLLALGVVGMAVVRRRR